MKIKTKSIEWDATRQPRTKFYPEHVADLAADIKSGAALPPITVFSPDGKAPYYGASGWHRLHAYIECGYTEVDADVLRGSEHDAFKFSLGTNVEHGKRRSNEDKRRSVLLAVSDGILSKMSDAKIAEACFVSVTFVADVRAKKAATDDEPVPATRIGKDGKSHPTTKKKKEDALEADATEPAEQKKHVPMFDAAGFEVPVELEDLFTQSQETQKRLLSLVSEVRSALRLRPNSFAFVSSEAFELAEALYAEMKPIALEHVCPKCHGKKCPVCHQLGLMPKSFYKSSVSQKDKA